MLFRLLLCQLWLLCAVAPAIAQQRGPGPFTHEPRSLRSRDFNQLHVRLDLKFDFERRQFTGRATHRLDLYRKLRSLELDAADMKIERVALATGQGSEAPTFRDAQFRHEGQKLHVDLPAETPLENLLIAIDYTVAQPKHGAHFVTPDASEPGSLTMVWTQSEPEFARYWFPCFDHPSDRLTSETIVTAPENFFVLSNGSLKEKKANGDGTQTWHWEQTQSHVAYLLSVVAGDFEAFEQQWAGIPVVAYVPRGRLDEAKLCFEKTPAMVQYFSEQLGYRYPWPKYTQICVDEYMWGGMEHTSCTTLNLGTLHDQRAHADELDGTDSLVAHELAHQWFGDLVTCKDWAELWLNESFATYFATLWTEHDRGWDEAVWDRRGDAEAYFAEDTRYRRSIVSYRYDRPEAMFDSHTYPKGGRVLHMLRFELGDERFWKTMHTYLEQNQFRTVETADLRRAVEETTGQGMNWFFSQWLEHGGHPEFTVSWSYNEETKQVAVQVRQTQKVDELTPLFRMHAEIEIATPSDTRTERIWISKADETFHFPATTRPTRVVFDPADWLLDKLTQEKSTTELLNQLAHDSHVFARFTAAQELEKKKDEKDVAAALQKTAKDDKFHAVRQEATRIVGQLAGDDVRRLMIDLAQHDPDVAVRREATLAMHRFAHDETRAALRQIITKESSYKVVAEALRSLVKVDRDHCREDLLAALAVPSHRDEVFRAAAAGLNELKDDEAVTRWRAMLKEKLTPDHRAAVVEALATAKRGDAETMELLKQQLEHRRPNLRRQAITTLLDLGDSSTVAWLQARRDYEESPRMVQQIDEAITKLRAKPANNDPVRKEIDELREKNRQLEERLKKLEKG
jgi:aminopeptidase N